MPLIIAIAAFITVSALFAIAYQYLTTAKYAIKDRIGRYVELQPLPGLDRPSDQLMASKTELTGLRAVLRQLSKYVEWAHLSRSLEHKLIQAGLPLRGPEFMVINLGSLLVAALISFALSGGNIIMGLVGGIVGYILPLLFLRIKITRRAKAFNGQLGDALTLVANSLRTGYSFMQAIELVSREMLPPISVEFARVIKEMSLGVTTEDALNNLAKRVDSDDCDLVITAVLIQRQIGGNLAEVLDNISATIRQRVKLRGEIQALTAQGRISGIIVGLLPFILGAGISVMNPGYMKVMFTHPLGHFLLGGALVSQLIGIVLVRRIVNIEL